MKTLKHIILPLSFLCLFLCALFLVQYFFEVQQEKSEQQELIQKKNVTTSALTSREYLHDHAILPAYKELYEENPDLIGWVKIEGTPLDYPVMQTKSDDEYYLHRNFEKEYQYSGLPFLDTRCDTEKPSTNLIIYGHNMKSEAMFSCLTRYKNEEYYKEHPVIRFDTVYKEAEYRIIAVVLSQVYKKSDHVFKFYQFVQAENEEDFNSYITNMKKLSLYDTEVDAVYGDQLLTLVTCSYHTDNGRIAVLAKKIRDIE